MARSATTQGSVASPFGAGVVYRPELFERLGQAGRVTELSAQPGSGKTYLLRSWIREAGLGESAAWVSVQREARDPQRFWLSVLDALRDTTPGSPRVGSLTAAPGLDGWAIVERLLGDLSTLDERLWLVIDDLQELRSDELLRQLELLLLRAPAELRFVLSTRHDLRLGLHRLRLEGELTEIRAGDLRFSLDEARALLEAAAVSLSDSALAVLHERTEGWAAGLRLAALSLAGHPDPERFAAEFSGSERTVAEYLLAEVLDRQPEEVRRLLLRTSILERVSGPLADVLTGGSGSEPTLQDLEEANAFVVSLDAGRSWFRYHHLFADLLQLELRRTAPDELPSLHRAAAEWYAEHGHQIEAIRHYQAAEDWSTAARLLSDHGLALLLDGQAATTQELLAGFPAVAVAGDGELAALKASVELIHGSLEQADRDLALASRRSSSLPPDRRERLQVRLPVLRLSLARRRGDLPAALEEAQRLLDPAEAPHAAQLGVGEDLRALALIDLGIAELWTSRLEEAERHLEQGIALAHLLERPYLEVYGLGHWAMVATLRSSAPAIERSTQAIELARRHGWSDEPIVGIAYVVLSVTRVWQGRLEEVERWLERAERTLRLEVEPVPGVLLHYARGLLELARGRGQQALGAFQAVERLAELLLTPIAPRMRAFRLQTLVQLGETQRVQQSLDRLEEQERDIGEMRIALAALQLAQDEPEAATVTLAPVLDGSAPVMNPRVWVVQAFLLEAIAQDALGDAAAAERALERALDLAEPDRVLLPFLLHPAPGLLEHHPRHRTAHAALIAEILNLLAGREPGSGRGEAKPLREPLTDSETRVLRYLPTNLSVQEIAGELYVSANTVKTHVRHLYAKLGTHARGEAVERARAVGLLAPSSRGR